MSPAAILLIAMLNQGHWIGGQPGQISLQWTAKSGAPAATVEWQLLYGQAKIADGRVALAAGAKESTLTITAPVVRAASEVRWTYRVVQVDNGRLITQGETTVDLYPADLLAPAASRLGAKTLAVWDKAEGLPKVLKDAKVPFTRIDDESKLQLAKFDVVIVAEDQLSDRPFGQAQLLGLAQSGASVLILRQSRVKAVGGYPLRQRSASPKIEWRENHLLTEHLRLRPLADKQDVLAIQLPADEPALELVFWPREVGGEKPAPIDALLVSKTLGQGRLVLCQVPLGNWQYDPIAQLFLTDAIGYLTGRAEPTPPPSERTQPKLLQPVRPSDILFPVESAPNR